MSVVEQSLRFELHRAQKRIKELEELVRPPVVLPIAFGLRPAEQRLFLALIHNEACSNEALLETVRKGDREVDRSIVKVRVCTLRSKMNTEAVRDITGMPFSVRTVHTVGYALNERPRWLAYLECLRLESSLLRSAA